MSKRRLAALSTVVTLAAAPTLTGCGSDAPTDEPSTSPPPTTLVAPDEGAGVSLEPGSNLPPRPLPVLHTLTAES